MGIVSTRVKLREPYRRTWVSDLLWWFSTIPVLKHGPGDGLQRVQPAKLFTVYLRDLTEQWRCDTRVEQTTFFCLQRITWILLSCWSYLSTVAAEHMIILRSLLHVAMKNWIWLHKHKKMCNISLLPLWLHNISTGLMFYARFTRGKDCCCTSVLYRCTCRHSLSHIMLHILPISMGKCVCCQPLSVFHHGSWEWGRVCICSLSSPDLDHFSPERSCPNAGFGSGEPVLSTLAVCVQFTIHCSLSVLRWLMPNNLEPVCKCSCMRWC